MKILRELVRLIGFVEENKRRKGEEKVFGEKSDGEVSGGGQGGRCDWERQ